MPKIIETARNLFALPPVWRRRLSILGFILAPLLAIYTLAGFFLAPYLISRYVPQYVSEQLHLQVRLDRVRINPLLFTCEVKGLSLRIDEEEPVFSIQRLFVDFELESLFRRAWTFGDLAIESPDLHLITGADSRLNLATLIDRLPQSETPEAEKKARPRLLFKHLALSGGTVQFDDRSKPRPATTIITPIALEFNGISTLPEHRGSYAVSASFPDDGGILGWKGEMSLQPISANGTIELKDFKLSAIWNLLQDQLNLEAPTGTIQMTMGYHFSSENGESAFALNPIALTVSGLSLAGKGAEPLLKLESLTASGGQIDFATRQMVFPSIALKGGHVAALVNKAGVANWQGFTKEPPQPPAKKTTSITTTPAAHEPPPWQIAVQSFSVTDLGLHYSDASRDTPISLDGDLAMSLTKGSLDLGKQEATIKRLALTGGGVTFTQSPASPGKAAKHTKVAEAEGETPQAESGSSQKKWRLALNQFSVAGFHLGFVDQKRTPALVYDLTGLQAEVKDFASPGEQPISFNIQTGIEQGGSASLNGTISQATGKPKKIEAQISIAQLDLKPLKSLVAEHAALTLVSGDLSANAQLLYAMGEPEPALTVKGEAQIGKLLLNEEKTGARLLAWKELAASGLDFGLNPDRLTIEQIRLREPGVKITIFKDKSLNLAKLRKQPKEEIQKEPEKPPFPVAVERVRINNGVVDFADFSLVLPFATRIEQCKGAVTGISTKAASRATLKFKGKVGEFGQAKAEGSLVPSNPKQFTDIKVIFRNVAMMPLSPYSATFAGRTIASGKLNLDLGYDIKDSELLGENSVVLQDFTLGDRVESPSAMDLPLDLAIALLTDSEGKIDIAMPIRGNIDHPEFSYGHLVRQALLNLLTKIVTSPFRALGAMLGTTSENPDLILFEPGRAELAPPEQEKLKNVAEVLGKRPEFHLTVHGGFAPSLDGTAIKRSQLRRTLVQKFGTKPGAMAFDNAKTQHALEKLAGDKLPAFQAGYEETTGQKVKRVNPALALLGRASEDSAFYRALFKHLVETAPLPQAELQTLGEQRGLAIVQELTSRFEGDPARISIGPAVQTEEQDKTIPAKLELGLR
jgi:hypothetical protein